MPKYTAAEVLAAREERADRIKGLLKQYNRPVIVLRVNYPGLAKTNALTLRMSRDMSALLWAIFGDKVCFQAWGQGADGPVFLAAVDEDVFVLKRTAVELEENHLLGRCLDFDVYAVSGNSLSRRELGYPARTCYLCADEAQNCVRSGRHSEREVIEWIEARYRDYQAYGDRMYFPGGEMKKADGQK